MIINLAFVLLLAELLVYWVQLLSCYADTDSNPIDMNRLVTPKRAPALVSSNIDPSLMNEHGNVDFDMDNAYLEQDDGDDADEVSDEDDESAVADSKKDAAESGSGEEAEEGESVGEVDVADISELDGKST